MEGKGTIRHRSKRVVPTGEAENPSYFAAIVESSNDAIISKDLRGIIQSWNRAAEEIFGYTAAEAIGQPIALIIPPELLEEERQIIARIQRGEQVKHYETIRRHKSGSLIDISLTISPIYNSQGIIGASKIARDIRERKRHERMLREQARLLNLSSDAIVVRDSNDRITYWNEGAFQMYGWKPQEALGKVSHDLLQTEFPESLDRIQHALATQNRWSGELVHRRRDGARIHVISRWALDRADDGAPRSVLETNTDITARRSIEQQLREANDGLERRVMARTAQLKESLGELEAFSYSLSHDMRAPLRAIQGFAQLLLDEGNARLLSDDKTMLDKIISSALRLDRLIQDVLALSRLSAEALSLRKVEIDPLIRHIITERPEFQPPLAIVQIQNPLPLVCGHEALLTQCVTNFLQNAVKFVASGVHPRVLIRSEEVAGGQVRLWFEDNGIGIPIEAQQRIFGIFERGQTAHAFPGTGIGLAIVKKAATRMEGSVGVESEPGKGSRFWLQLQKPSR